MNEDFHDCVTGASARKAACAPAILGAIAFWVGMFMAGVRYPDEFDWRYMTISSLTSPARNPTGHLWASGGMLLCFLCGLLWLTRLARNWNHNGAGIVRGIASLRVGVIFTACAAVLPSSLIRIRKGHEILALVAFIGWCVGILQLTFQTAEQILRRRFVGGTRCARICAAALVGAAVCPLFLAGLTQAYVRYALPKLRWVNLAWRAQGVPAYLKLCVLGMGDLRRALGLHGRAVAGGTRGDIRFLEPRIVTTLFEPARILCAAVRTLSEMLTPLQLRLRQK